MNFTREPIIETVITPKEGCKLVLRSSKGGEEEFIVEAVEVVSFGRSFFFRSIEGIKAFLVPVSDYEVLETKEERIALKNAPADRQIKIGGGREAQPRSQQRRSDQQAESRQEGRAESRQEKSEEAKAEGYTESNPPNSQQDRKRDRRRRGRRGRGGPDRQHEVQQHPESRERSHHTSEEASHEAPSEGAPAPQTEEAQGETPKAPSFMSRLFPPPPTLIKETLSRYKTTEEVEVFPEEEKETFPDQTFDQPIPNEKDEDIHFEDR